MPKPKKKRPPHRKPAPRCLVSGYTALDELLASPTHPFPAGTFDRRIGDTMDAFAKIEAGTANVYDWACCCSAANTVETLLAWREIEDHDGLLADAFAGLKASVQRMESSDDPVVLEGAALEDLRDMLDGWADLLRTKPARVIVRAERETDRRAREVAAGRMSINDLLVVSS